MAGERQPRCTCPRCRVRLLTGPVMLITVGVLFLVGEYTRYSFGYLWPILLIVAGLMQFAQAVAPDTGHIDRRPPRSGRLP
jgi:hypothetical protein